MSRIAFESNVERELARVRRENAYMRGLAPSAYISSSNELAVRRGTDDGPYSLIVGRAAADGAVTPPLDEDGSQGNSVLDGQGQRLLTDEWGRLWTKSAGGVVVEPTMLRATTGDAAVLQTAPITPPEGLTMRVRWIGVNTVGGVAAGRVLMAFDSADAVIDGADPIWRAVMLDAGAGYFNSVDVEFNNGGLLVVDGLVLALSTTLDDLTQPGAAEGWFQALYTWS